MSSRSLDKAIALHERVRLARVEERQDVRVLEVRRRLDLGQEPFGTDDCRELGFQNFERDVPFVLQVVGE